MQIEGIEGKYTKFSNNTEKVGKSDKFASGWTLPLEFNLTIEQFEAAFDQKYFGRAFFNEKKKVQYSAWKDFIGFPIKIALEYENSAFALTFVGGKEVEWDQGCSVDSIECEPIDNGTVTVWCHVYVHPTAAQKKLLDEYQHSTVTIDISGGEISSKMKRKQADMFDGKEAGEEGAQSGKEPEVGAGFAAAAAAKTQATAWEKGTPNDGAATKDTH
jgi:hypothetical protein